MSQNIRNILICVAILVVIFLALNCDKPGGGEGPGPDNPDFAGLELNGTGIRELLEGEENATAVVLSTNLFEIGPVADVTFFGLQAYGTKHVFVLDSSGSMGTRMGAGSRFEKQKGEVIRTVRSLKPEIEYAVIFYDSVAHFEGSLRLRPATRENIEQTAAWVNSRPLGGPNLVMEGMRPATTLDCHTIYLLSDGMPDLDATQVRRDIRALNVSDKIHINTIGLQDPVGRTLMEQIAADNGGRFKFIP
jgi:hypothetical protein